MKQLLQKSNPQWIQSNNQHFRGEFDDVGKVIMWDATHIENEEMMEISGGWICIADQRGHLRGIAHGYFDIISRPTDLDCDGALELLLTQAQVVESPPSAPSFVLLVESRITGSTMLWLAKYNEFNLKGRLLSEVDHTNGAISIRIYLQKVQSQGVGWDPNTITLGTLYLHNDNIIWQPTSEVPLIFTEIPKATNVFLEQEQSINDWIISVFTSNEK